MKDSVVCWGWIDQTGKIVISCLHEEIVDAEHEMFERLDVGSVEEAAGRGFLLARIKQEFSVVSYLCKPDM